MTGSPFSTDILDLFKLLDEHQVKYLIVGGEAVIYYGYPRLTGDIDLFYENSIDNLRCLWDTLELFWGGSIPGIQSMDELMIEGMVFQFGLPPNRIDLINHIDGVSFQEAWDGKVDEKIEIQNRGIPVYYIGLSSLIRNKTVLSRPKDQEDLKYLEELKKRKSEAGDK
ncbi:hypothetical protein HQ585_06280 [candidate division KSB1 bacterium]|nr:hypothetical protein [candidate division KSB1 bacterium]